MKLNNKGFAISGILYSFIVLFLMMLLLILMNLSSKKVVLDRQKADVLNEINDIQDETLVYKELLLNGAYPELYTGLIPVIISNDGTVTIADMSNEWYSYEEKKWANAVMIDISDSTIKDTYFDSDMNLKQDVIGTTIPETSINSYFVWIPRYKYKIFNLSDIDPTTIDIVFESRDTLKSNSDLIDSYLTHPSFTMGERELNGFWVSKFEITGSSSNPTSKPNISALRNLSLTDFYSTSLLFNSVLNSYISESHMIRNSEWGAITYLSHSLYGINNEVTINNNNNYTTGCGSLAGVVLETDQCENAYGSVTSYTQSTTGNITGVFDMNGGSNEFVFAGLNISSLNGISLPSSEYYKNYTTTDSLTACSGKCFGESLFETHNWYSDEETFVTNSNPWLLRGGTYLGEAISGINSYSSSTYDGSNSVSSRVSISKK